MPVMPNKLQLIPTDPEPALHQLLDVVPAAAYTCDQAGLITYFNANAVRLWGRKPKLNDSIDRFCGSFRLLTAEGEPLRHDQCWMAMALANNQDYNGCEIIVERPDGTRRTALAHANPFRDKTGKPMGAVNMLVDITDRKQAETALIIADRRKDEFLATLAHELRNPLSPLSNAIQLMRMNRDNPRVQERSLDIMDRQLKQMVRLVDDLMDVSRISRNKLTLRKERLALGSVLQVAIESTRPLIDQCGHQLTIALPTEPLYVEADRTRLAQVFSNLLTNAAKYMQRYGRIWVDAEQSERMVKVRVRDAGIGMSAELIQQIFEPFVQGTSAKEHEQGGLGIGLSLARSLVEMHGGVIGARSGGNGQGSEFVVELPMAANKPAHEDTARNDRRKSEMNHKGRVLIVDDYADSATTLASMLSMSGYETQTALDGVTAIATAEAFIPDAALIDIGLPKLNGYQVARAIRREAWGKRILLVAVTGWGQDEDRRLSAEAGFDLHLVKPIDPMRILSALTGITKNG